jgi:hypothetical protein
MSAGSVNVAEFLASQGLLTGTREERDAAIAEGWDSMSAYIKRSSDEKLRADNPGIGDEDIARWRQQAADPNPVKRAGDFWYPRKFFVTVTS